jgi:ubiquitin C-terminal hydrolase
MNDNENSHSYFRDNIIIDNNNINLNIDFKLNVNQEGYDNNFSFSGLRNVGLTCYMNSTLQLLLHIPELNSFFINIYSAQRNDFNRINKEADTKGRLSEEYYKLVNKLNFVNINSISPRDFNNILSALNPQFRQFESNDSKDLLLYLIQSMHAELNYYGDKKLNNIPKCNQLIESDSFNFFDKVNNELNLSIFSYLFYGILKSRTKCTGCNKKLYNFQYFQFLVFPVFNFKDKKLNVYSGFKEFIKTEAMTGDNQYYCQHCKGLRDAKENSIIFYTPPYLIINLDYGKDKKYRPTNVEFGQIFELSGFTDEKCTQRVYELIGVSTHIGSSGNSGHYIAYCKNLQDNCWYKFNDSSVNICEFEEVKNNTPYLLVFKRQ